MKNKKNFLINSEIKNQNIRITGEFATNKIISLSEALALAEKHEADLILLNDRPDFAICQIINYDKFLYELNKKEKSKPKPLEVKEIKVGPNTSENDLSYRIKQMQEFLIKGHKIKISMQFKGREMAFIQKGEALILELIMSLKEHGVAEMLPKLEGKKMFVTIRPIAKK